MDMEWRGGRDKPFRGAYCGLSIAECRMNTEKRESSSSNLGKRLLQVYWPAVSLATLLQSAQYPHRAYGAPVYKNHSPNPRGNISRQALGIETAGMHPKVKPYD